MEAKTISALMVAPGEHPVVTTLCCCRQFLDLAVSFGAGDPCEASFLRLRDNVGVLYNREASFYRLRGNRRIGNKILAGVFYIVGVEAGRLASLSDEQVARYEMMFYDPETYTEQEVDEAFFDSWIDETEQSILCY